MSITQEIRNAAINWPTPLSIPANEIVGMFGYQYDEDEWTLIDLTDYRVFLLMVAEELSPSLPALELRRAAEMLEWTPRPGNWTEANHIANVLRDLVRGM